jgi:formylglycine-generating enzyme required for sulfatase activity
MFTARVYLAFPVGLALSIAASLAPLPAYTVKDKDDVKAITNSIGMKLVRIPVGKFLMGSPKDEKDRKDDEEQHEVEITKPFYMGACTVTQAQYVHVMDKNPSWFCAQGHAKDKIAGMDTSRFPVEQVSWDDAVAFCKNLSELPEEKKAGRIYRLPTEAEWEYACRAGTTTPFHFGISLSWKQANFDDNWPFGKGPYLKRTTTVGSYKPNAFGLYDMHGNVWQWCRDWYARKHPGGKDPEGTTAASSRVIRGGSWNAHGRDCRSAARFRFDPGRPHGAVGFRVVAVYSGR